MMEIQLWSSLKICQEDTSEIIENWTQCFSRIDCEKVNIFPNFCFIMIAPLFIDVTKFKIQNISICTLLVYFIDSDSSCENNCPIQATYQENCDKDWRYRYYNQFHFENLIVQSSQIGFIYSVDEWCKYLWFGLMSSISRNKMVINSTRNHDGIIIASAQNMITCGKYS